MGTGSVSGDTLVHLGLAGETGSIARLADTRSEIGSARSVLDRTSERLADTQVNVEGQISDVEDVDITRVMTEISQERVTLESSYAVTARMARTSLLNFIQ